MISETVRVVLHAIAHPKSAERVLVRRVVIIKSIVMVGLVASYFVPADAVAAVGIASNLLWLWKT